MQKQELLVFLEERSHWLSGATDETGGGSSERPVGYLCSGASFCSSSVQGPVEGMLPGSGVLEERIKRESLLFLWLAHL